MTDNVIDYGDEHAPKAQDGQLSRLSQMVDDMEAEQVRVAQIEEALKEARAKVRSYAESQIPALMQEIGVKTITTGNGVTVSLKTKYRASPKVADRDTAWAWLEENGHGGLLKEEVAVAFGRGEHDDALQLEAQLREAGATVKRNRAVHPQTLKAWVKEMIESGRNIPMDIFGAEVIEEAQVKRNA